MLYDTVFRGAAAVLPDGVRPVDVCVKDGKIAAVLAPGSATAAARMIDCDGLHLLPGLIDTHMHVGGPTYDYREDFTSGSAAAAGGGITTMLEMPLSSPPAYSVEILKERIADAEKKGLIGIGFYGAAGSENLEHIIPLSEAGVIGYKTFTQYPANGRETDFFGLCTPTSADLYRVCCQVARTGRVLAVHADTDCLIDMFKSDPSFGQDGAPVFGRPPVEELEATVRALAIAKYTGVRLSICHISLPEIVEIVHSASLNGLDVTAESCLHYLTASQDDYKRHGAYANIKPPLRYRDTAAQMWELFAQGKIDFLGSDHCAYTDEEKSGDSPKFGLAGAEATLPILLLGVAEGRFSLEHIVKVCCENSAKRFDLFPKKGRIAPGADADLVLVDLSDKEPLDTSKMHTKWPNCASIYNGRKTGGKVLMTMAAGIPVMENGQITAKAGSGSIVYPNGYTKS